MNLQRQSKRRSSRSSSVIDANQAASSSKKTPQVSSGRLPQCRRCLASPNLMTVQGSGTGTSLLIHRIGGTLTRPGGSATRTARQDSGLTLPADQSRQNSEFYWEAGLLAQPTRSSKDLPPQNSSPHGTGTWPNKLHDRRFHQSEMPCSGDRSAVSSRRRHGRTYKPI